MDLFTAVDFDGFVTPSQVTGCFGIFYVIVVPGEGIVRTISAVTRRPFGTCKVAFDVTLVTIAVILSFALFGRLNGLGVGTIVSALLVGRLCNLINLHVPLIARIARLTRSAHGAPEDAL